MGAFGEVSAIADCPNHQRQQRSDTTGFDRSVMITLSASALSPEAVNGDRFHGIAARCALKEEQPYHRHAAWLMAMGADTREVATALDVTTTAVRQWLREPWFQARVTVIMREHGGRDLTQLFANEAFASLGVMLELRDNPKIAPAVRNNICQNILDRYLGKPTQRVEQVDGPTSADPVAEVERLEQENNRMRGYAAESESHV